MTLYDEVLRALQARLTAPPALDDQLSRQWQGGLQRVLGTPVLDRSDYRTHRFYRFEAFLHSANSNWANTLTLTVSRYGPFAHFTIYRSLLPDTWWGGRIQTDRRGYTAEDQVAVQRLRTWCEQHKLALVDGDTQAQFLPKELLRHNDPAETTIFRALFQSA